MAGIIFSSKEHLSLAKAEVDAYFTSGVVVVDQGIFLTSKPVTQQEIQKFGFAKQSFIVRDSFSLDSLFEGENISEDEKTQRLIASCVTSLQKHAQDNYCLQEVFCFHPSITLFSQDFYKQIASKLPYKVNLSQPQLSFSIIVTNDLLYVLELVGENTDSAHKRRAHLQAVSKPIAIHPKIAKAMNILAQSEVIVDPCCGAGGLLIEVALQGFVARGSDIRQDMVQATKENAKHFGVVVAVTQQDFFDSKDSLPCIVTDLPYGRNSSLSLSKNSFYTRFFEHAQQLTKRLVVGLDSQISIQKNIESTLWIIDQEHEIYIHKSMTRKIYVLTQ